MTISELNNKTLYSSALSTLEAAGGTASITFTLRAGATVITTASIAVSRGLATLWSLRQMVEQYMLSAGAWYETFTVTAGDSTATFNVLYSEQKQEGNPQSNNSGAWLLSTDCFLLDTSQATDFPVAYFDSGSSDDVEVGSCQSALTHSGPLHYGTVNLAACHGPSRLEVTAGSRSLAVVKAKEKPVCAFIFANTFNAPELVHVFGKQTHDEDVSVKTARVGREDEQYDRQVANTYEVETSPLLPSQLEQMRQLLASPAIREAGTDKLVLIDSSEYKISNERGKPWTVKFTWRYSDSSSIKGSDRGTADGGVFTEQFTEQFT